MPVQGALMLAKLNSTAFILDPASRRADVAAPHNIEALLKKEIPGFSMDRARLSFEELGVDSFSMLELRVAIERVTGQTIPDAIWMEFDTPATLLLGLGQTTPIALA